jgi:transposase-like protein
MLQLESPVRDDSLPGSLPEFLAKFGDEAECAKLLHRWKYPSGFRCPRCAGTTSWFLAARALDECSSCGFQASLTAGTIFHKTRKPLSTWFAALFLFVSSKQGISAMELGRQLELRQATAWTWLHKIRGVLGARAKELLAGVVEVDETYVGGVAAGVTGRGAPNKSVVAAAVEIPPDDRGFGRARLRVLRDASSRSLEDFLDRSVRGDATAITDGWRSYNEKVLGGREHVAVNVSKSGIAANRLLPGVHRIFALLHRVLLGTYQGGVRHKHLDAYLDEFEFRFNRRNSRSRGLLFQRLLSCGVQSPSPTYAQIVARRHPRSNPGNLS